ncbi:MAG: transglutaminase-like domain-containing protein, partial [Propionivibrio sp.]
NSRETRLKRRDFLAASAMLSLLATAPVEAAKKKASAKKSTAKKTPVQTPVEPAPEEPRNVISLPDEPLPQWQHYDIETTITLQRTEGKVRVWLPLAQYKDTLWERSLGHHWEGNFASAGIYRDPVADMEVFYADWADGVASPQLQISSQVATQDRHFDITRRGAIAERTEVLRRCLRATELVPLDGIVRQTAERAIGRVKDPVAQGKAIYDWVVDNVAYDGSAYRAEEIDIGAFLAVGDLRSRSAGFALLFTGLCRAIGIPARPVFGLRIDRSRLFDSLGASGNLAAAQQSRAEFYAPGYGWIAVNPADVRKAILDEKLSDWDPKLTVLKKLLFGFWEMNWISFNAALDVSLRGASGRSLPFLNQPEAARIDEPFERLIGDQFAYTVTARHLDAPG